jgi:HAD superfamily hydrolase (TIGR01549 family)
MKKLLIFDFDGTLVDTKDLYYNSIYTHLKEQGMEISKDIFNDKLLGLKLHDILEKLGIKKNKDKIKNKVHNDVFKSFKEIKSSNDVKYLENIKTKKIILSNTITEHILPVLKNNKIDYFDEIYGGDKFGSKDKFIKSYIKKNHLKKGEVVYIGDMIKDVEVAKKAGVTEIAIAHKISWNSEKELLRAGPDYLITNLRDVEKLVR